MSSSSPKSMHPGSPPFITAIVAIDLLPQRVRRLWLLIPRQSPPPVSPPSPSTSPSASFPSSDEPIDISTGPAPLASRASPATDRPSSVARSGAPSPASPNGLTSSRSVIFTDSGAPSPASVPLQPDPWSRTVGPPSSRDACISLRQPTFRCPIVVSALRIADSGPFHHRATPPPPPSINHQQPHQHRPPSLRCPPCRVPVPCHRTDLGAS